MRKTIATSLKKAPALILMLSLLGSTVPASATSFFEALRFKFSPSKNMSTETRQDAKSIEQQSASTTKEQKAPTGKTLLDVPLMNQYTAGGSYPGGYCAITALRMLLRFMGIKDPGANTVALQGSRPYIPGSGSDGALLARRAQQLGIPTAKYTNTGTLKDVRDSVNNGKPTLHGGIGVFEGTATDGSGTYRHNYAGSGHWMTTTGYDNNNKTYVVNDPATGKKYNVSENAFLRFFSPGGDGNMWMISY